MHKPKEIGLKKNRPALEQKSFLFYFILFSVYLLKKKGSVIIKVGNLLSYFTGYYCDRCKILVIRIFNDLRETQFGRYLTKSFVQVLSLSNGKLVFVNIPKNLDIKHNHLFKNRFYVFRSPRLIQLNNVFILFNDYLGICYKNYKMISESMHGLWERRRIKEIYPTYYKLTTDTFLRSKYNNGVNVLNLDESKKYLHVHHGFNYYHWLTETLYRLWLVRDQLAEYTGLLPEKFKNIGFVQDSLAMFPIGEILYIQKNTNIMAKKIDLVELKPYCDHYDPEQHKALGTMMSDAVTNKGYKIDFGEKVFISRKKAERRRIVNESEVERLLKTFGFSTVYFENYSFYEQVAIMKNVKFLVGTHGAGLTNMMFMQTKGKVLELHKKLENNQDLHSVVYWKLCDALKHDYYYQFCKPVNQNEDWFKVDLEVDIGLFEKNLQLLTKA